MQAWQRPGAKPSGGGVREAAWLALQAVQALLEASVVALLAQGYLADGSGALLKPLGAAGALAAADTATKVVAMHWLGIPLYPLAAARSAAAFWAGRSALVSAAYAAILAAPHVSRLDWLPARPAFHSYFLVLLALYITCAVGALAAALGLSIGFCAFSLASYAYYALFPPLVYFTFLDDLLKDNVFDMDDIYYSEMKDAGYFDAEWD
eukprot:SM000058S18581  [mRNA]  locus=s58:618497:619605:- [translate_table: standard]